MGRLRANQDELNIYLFNKFQFQYGAIKSEKIDKRRESGRLFQFQYGAIKRY